MLRTKTKGYKKHRRMHRNKTKGYKKKPGECIEPRLRVIKTQENA